MHEREEHLSANGYIKAAMVASLVSVVVVFLLVYRLLDLPAERQAGVSLQSVQSGPNPVATPSVATPTATPTPPADTGITAVAVAAPNVHTAADVNSQKVGVLSRGDKVPVLGRSADSAWIEIRYAAAPNGAGWVSTSLMTVTPGVAGAPVVQSP